jgi:hypothetical protein
MNKLIFLVLSAIVIVAVVFFYCASPSNPYVPGNAKISVYLLDSRGIQSMDPSVTDTVGHTVKVGISPYLYSYIDSVVLTMIDYNNGSDSALLSDGMEQWRKTMSSLAGVLRSVFCG